MVENFFTLTRTDFHFHPRLSLGRLGKCLIRPTWKCVSFLHCYNTITISLFSFFSLSITTLFECVCASASSHPRIRIGVWKTFAKVDFLPLYLSLYLPSHPMSSQFSTHWIPAFRNSPPDHGCTLELSLWKMLYRQTGARRHKQTIDRSIEMAFPQASCFSTIWPRKAANKTKKTHHIRNQNPVSSGLAREKGKLLSVEN